MPVYEYECNKCGHIQHVTHSIKKSPKVKCEKCKSTKMERNISGGYCGYIRGEGLVRDKGGAKRDMNLYQLQNDDPYSKYRVPGEKSDMVERMKHAAIHHTDIQRSTTYKYIDGELRPVDKNGNPLEEIDDEDEEDMHNIQQD